MPSVFSLESRFASPVSLGPDVPLVLGTCGPMNSVFLGANGMSGNNCRRGRGTEGVAKAHGCTMTADTTSADAVVLLPRRLPPTVPVRVRRDRRLQVNNQNQIFNPMVLIE